MVTRGDAPPSTGAKATIADLAVCGGTPRFATPLHVGAPNLGDRRRLFERIDGMFDRRWLTNDGPLVPEFEAEIARRTGARHCVAVCNATTGIDLTCRALGMHGEVIVPAFTFVAPVHALTWAGATPVFCDVDPDTHLIDPDAIEATITPRTTGILGVHVWGRMCDAARIHGIARRHGLPLLFDAAHAFGTAPSSGNTTHGDATVFSFHATKIVNAFEGGAVVTDDAALADSLRARRTFGFTGVDRVEGLGINAKMSEASAAMGLTSLDAFDRFVAANRRNYAAYAEGLAGLAGVHLRPPEEMADTTMHYVVVEIDPATAGFTRDLALRVLDAEGVRARRYFYPGCHRVPPYSSRPSAGPLPVTDRLCQRVLQLPTATATSAADVAAICQILQVMASDPAALTARLQP